MTQQLNLKEEIHRLLTPQKTLAPWVFDEKKKMLPFVRKSLLNIAQKIIDKTIKPIEGLEVSDILLCGSSTDYFYRDQSDLDLFIKVDNNGCSSISKGQKHLDRFLFSQTFPLTKYAFYYGTHYVDIKVESSKETLFLGVYSILNDSWLIKPNKNIVKGLTEEEIASCYVKKRYEILTKKQKLIEKYSGIKLAKHLSDLYAETALNPTNIKDYCVFKLLNYEGIIKRIGIESIMAYNRVLRL